MFHQCLLSMPPYPNFKDSPQEETLLISDSTLLLKPSYNPTTVKNKKENKSPTPRGMTTSTACNPNPECLDRSERMPLSRHRNPPSQIHRSLTTIRVSNRFPPTVPLPSRSQPSLKSLAPHEVHSAALAPADDFNPLGSST